MVKISIQKAPKFVDKWYHPTLKQFKFAVFVFSNKTIVEI